jgi:hypothetical protein
MYVGHLGIYVKNGSTVDRPHLRATRMAQRSNHIASIPEKLQHLFARRLYLIESIIITSHPRFSWRPERCKNQEHLVLEGGTFDFQWSRFSRVFLLTRGFFSGRVDTALSSLTP